MDESNKQARKSSTDITGYSIGTMKKIGVIQLMMVMMMLMTMMMMMIPPMMLNYSNTQHLLQKNHSNPDKTPVETLCTRW